MYRLGTNVYRQSKVAMLSRSSSDGVDFTWILRKVEQDIGPTTRENGEENVEMDDRHNEG